ncbi:DUF1120 domain-containing protein [Pseudomonas moorei]|uniref:DUF1120 domain-containing protein n=1 Tax=Pseudomonas moorei TaxID=395599 RepID=UPI00200FEB14|nr:DUF1120 domain-containing protein [Pseudomonas moorei]
MNKTLSALCTALLLTTASPAFAASTDLTVTGVITPSACTPTLSGGGIVDHGKISAKDLRPDNPTTLPKLALQMAVNCDAPVQYYFSPIDHRAGTAWGTRSQFGLGLTNAGEKLGSFMVDALNMRADGVDVQHIASTDGGKTWIKDYWDADNLWAVGAMDDTSTPLRVKDLTLDLRITTQIASTRELTLTDDVLIDGSATLQLKYL